MARLKLLQIKAATLISALAAPGFPALAAGKPGLSPFLGVDVCRQLRPDQGGLELAEAGSAAWLKLLETVQLTAAAKTAYAFADNVIQDVAFDEVLASPLATVKKDGTRAFSFTGIQHSRSYDIDYHKAALTELSAPSFLSFAAELDVRADKEQQEGFGLGLKAKGNSGEFSHRTLARLGAGLLSVLDPANLKLLAKARPGQSDDAVAEARATLPTAMALAERYMTLSVAPQLTAAYTQINSSSKLKLEGLRQDYPQLAQYVERLTDNLELQVHLVVRQQNGLTLGEASVDSRDYSGAMSLKTSGGQILPYDAAGTVAASQAIDPVQLKDFDGTLECSFHAKVLGLTISDAKIEVALHYQDDAVAQMSARLSKMPVPQIEGYALGFMPTWAVSAVMPGGNLDEVTKALTEGLLRGSQGKGTFAAASLDTRQPEAKGAVVAGTELVDNFYLTLGLTIMQKYLWPLQEALTNLIS